MRTIKFKAKNRICEWVKGDLLQHLDGTVYIGENEGPWTDDGLCHSDYKHVEIVDSDTVCQFTGFLDKNGKEIYEGDVLRSDEYPFSCTERNEIDNYYGVIGWSDEEALFYMVAAKTPKSSVRGISDGISDSISQKMMQDFEVIGNVHDEEWKQYREYAQDEDEE